MGQLVLYLVKYENEQKAQMLENPAMRERAAIHRSAIADFGGKPIAQYGSYGEYDMVYIYEMPDDVALAANLHLTDSLGLAKYSKAIPLMDNEAFVQSLGLAHDTDSDYKKSVQTAGGAESSLAMSCDPDAGSASGCHGKG